MPNVPRHLYLVNCFKEGMLEFDDPMGQCFGILAIISQRRSVCVCVGGGGGEEERYGIDRKSKSKLSHTAPV